MPVFGREIGIYDPPVNRQYGADDLPPIYLPTGYGTPLEPRRMISYQPGDQGMGLNDLLLNPKLVAGKTFHIEYRSDLLGGVVAICGQASIARKTQWEDILYRPWPLQYKMADMMAVPYYAWDNREPGEMRVWLRVSSGS